MIFSKIKLNWLIQNTSIYAIVNMPSGTFSNQVDKPVYVVGVSAKNKWG